jgi:hypothetical protein
VPDIWHSAKVDGRQL